MYAHILRGRVRSGAEAAEHWRRWVDEVAPLAAGWLDSTGGATTDGRLVAVTRFATEDDARTTTTLEEHRSWWEDARPLFQDDPAELDSGDVPEAGDDPDPSAGFVQMMLATVAERAVVERIEEEIDEAFQRWRPDLLGGYRVWLPGCRVLAVDCFTSEADARAGEQREPPPEVAEAFPLWQAQLSDVEWFDFAEHWVAR